MLAAIKSGLVESVRTRRTVRAVPWPPDGGHLTVSHVEACRQSLWSRVKRSCTLRSSRYLQKWSSDVGDAERYVSTFLQEPPQGLPDAMQDPDSKDTLCGGEQVVDAAARYIEARGKGRE